MSSPTETKVTPQVTPPSLDHEKAEVSQLEKVSTQENPPGKGRYTEEDGLRTEGKPSLAVLRLPLRRQADHCSIPGDGVFHQDTPVGVE